MINDVFLCCGQRAAVDSYTGELMFRNMETWISFKRFLANMDSLNSK